LIVSAIFAPPMAVLSAYLAGQLAMLLWNYTMPPLFGLPAVTFWQALGLLALSWILFGRLNVHGCRRSERRTDFRRGHIEHQPSGHGACRGSEA
jgi:hypothetical protein